MPETSSTCVDGAGRVVRIGILSRSGRDVPLGRMNDARFSHNLIQRILGTGTLTVESGGENGQLVLKNIPEVERVQREMYELINGPVRPSQCFLNHRDALRPAPLGSLRWCSALR